MTEEETEDLLRDMWKAEGCWTQEEEKEYQEKRKTKREPKYTRAKKPGGKVQKPKPKSSD